MKNLDTGIFPTWCPGCGDFAIFSSIKNAIGMMDYPAESYFFTYGIGCHGHMCNFLDVYGFETLHGRPLPVAEGAKLANRDLNVIAVSGDGDSYGEGISHFMHIMRRNIDLTLIVHNNRVYGLTTGQVTPTSQKGFRSKSTPDGTIEQPMNPISTAILGGATFVARGFAGDPAHLSSLIVEGVKHKGFALIDVFQPCVTFNHINTYQWYREKVYKLEGNNTSDRMEALRISMEQDKLPIGIFFREEAKTYEEQVATQVSLSSEPVKTDIKDLIESFR
ncbi:2-oxoacid ferredoxin oxidoreductase [Candidatus Woesearchaeota archaeon]|nr:2-oxoacid ferredoxin oxidoreductase [Candidatus Woesearchaeota archaeon]